MDCKNFGIGLIVLSVTLFFGVTIGEFFKSNETRIPEIEVIEESVDLLNNLSLDEESLKDCKSADNDLRYRTLLFSEKERIYKKIDKRDKIEKAASESSVKLSKEDISSNKTLVYKEICREKENGRKNGAKINN